MVGAEMLGQMIGGGIVYILMSLAYFRLFKKAGEAGWKGFVPILNCYTQFKLTWNTKMFWYFAGGELVGTFFSDFDGMLGGLGMLIMLASGVIYLLSLNKLSKAYGRGIGTTLGLIFLNPIFLMFLGFGSAEYEGPQ